MLVVARCVFCGMGLGVCVVRRVFGSLRVVCWLMLTICVLCSCDCVVCCFCCSVLLCWLCAVCRLLFVVCCLWLGVCCLCFVVLRYMFDGCWLLLLRLIVVVCLGVLLFLLFVDCRWALFVYGWFLVLGSWLFVVGCWLLVVGCWFDGLFFVGCCFVGFVVCYL